MIPSIRRFALLAVSTFAFLAVAAGPALGAEIDWIVRATGSQLIPDLSYETLTDEGFPVAADSSSDTGWALGLEMRATPKLGVGIRYVKASPTIRITIDGAPALPVLEARDDLGVTMYAASLNLHLTPDRPVDLWISPVLAYLSFDDLLFAVNGPGGLSDTLALEVDRDVTWGIEAGVDIPLGDSAWMATASASYLDSTLEFTEVGEQGSEDLSFDPVVVSVGIGYRF
jgi:outer membrane protein W